MATKTKPVGRDVYVPINGGFIADIDGTPVNFHSNIRVREGHPILERFPHLFAPIHVNYDLEEASDRPGEPR